MEAFERTIPGLLPAETTGAGRAFLDYGNDGWMDIAWQAQDLQRTRLKNGGGYLSSHHPREVLGISKRARIDRLEIRWPQPGGKVETFSGLPVDRYITIVEGHGIK